jgi:hypothetical protein
MSQGYPARKRTRKAYWRGVKSAKFARTVNPYKNEVLRELFERGRTRVVPIDPLGARPPGPGPQASRAPQPPPRSTRPNDRGNERRDPFRGGR